MNVLVAPRGTRDFLRQAVTDGGGTVVDSAADADAVVWTSPKDPEALRALLEQNPRITWVQLPWSGIEHYLEVLDRERLWTAAQGIYAKDVAEHVLALTLAGLRDFKKRALATSWQAPSGRSLHGAHVVVLGAGGITRALQPLLAPFSVRLTVVRNQPVAHEGAQVVAFADRRAALKDADVVVVALALTPQTRGCIGAAELSVMKKTALLVNVARGGHVDVGALMSALDEDRIAGACLDVTDPEPLPPGHRLWSYDNVLITPHCANTPEMAVPVLTERVKENVRRRIASETLLGVVDVDAGY